MRVVISSDTDKHAALLPIALAGWKKYFPEVKRTVVIVSREDETIPEIYTALADEVVYIRSVPSITYENQCKLARMYQACKYGDEVVTLEDADLVPLNAAFRNEKWEQRKPGQLLMVGREVYAGEDRIKGRAPMSQLTSESNVLRVVTGNAVDDFAMFLGHCISIGIQSPTGDADPCNTKQTFSDESLLKTMIDIGDWWSLVVDVVRGYNWPADVIDRGAKWDISKSKLAADFYKEAHLYKPLYWYTHRWDMQPIIDHLGLTETYADIDRLKGQATRRILIVQNAGEHEINKHMRECLSMQRALSVDNVLVNVAEKLDTICTDQYDTIMVMEQYDTTTMPEISEWTNNGQCKIFWSIDAHKAFEMHADYCKRNGFDIVLCSSLPYVERFLDHGLTCEFFPNCVDESFFPAERNETRTIPVGFCGHVGNRKEWLDALGIESTQKYGADMVAELCNTKIEWNRNEADDINYRTFEAAAAGCCVVTNKTPGIDDIFRPNEIVTYTTMQECQARLWELKQDPARVKSIAEAGMKRVLENHTYNARAVPLLVLSQNVLNTVRAKAGCSIGLHMIVGGGEAKDLDRCLSTFAVKELFDEVVIAVTAEDQAVYDVAHRHATKVISFPWVDDFATARNTALDELTTDYAMWLDADDVCLPRDLDKFKKFVGVVRGCAGKVDVFFVPYTLICDMNLRPELSFYKERCFKRSKAFRWKYPVHELIYENWHQSNFVTGKVNNLAVTHGGIKAPAVSAARNVRILERLYNAGNRSPHTMHFLAQDYMVLGRIDESERMYHEIISAQEESPDVLYINALNMSYSTLYGHLAVRPALGEAEGMDQAEQWIRLALGFNQGCAEPWVMLGDVYLRRGLHQAATECYRRALGCGYGTGGIQCRPYYKEVPSWRLGDICESKHDLEQALWYNKRALTENECDLYRAQRKRIIEELHKEIE